MFINLLIMYSLIIYCNFPNWHPTVYTVLQLAYYLQHCVFEIYPCSYTGRSSSFTLTAVRYQCRNVLSVLIILSMGVCTACIFFFCYTVMMK